MELKKTSEPKTEQPTEGSALLRAINATLRALEDRGSFFRNLVVAVVVVVGTSVFTSTIFQRWMPLFCCILIIPMVGVYLVLDSVRVRRWRTEILQICRTEVNDYSLFKKTILEFRHLPARSLMMMLATLPETVDEQAATSARGKTDEFYANCRRHEQKILSIMFLWTVTLSTLSAAAIYHSRTLFVCAAGLVAIVAIIKAM